MKKEIYDTAAFKEVSEKLGREMAEEVLDYGQTANDFLADQTAEDCQQAFKLFALKMTFELPGALQWMMANNGMIATIFMNLSVWGGFFYRRWLIQGGADIKALEEQARQSGKLKEKYHV